MNIRDAAAKKKQQKAAPLFAKAKAKKRTEDPAKKAKQIIRDSKKGLAAIAARKKELAKLASKQDFIANGIKYHNCRQYPSYWTVDVTNGDTTVTAHEKFGSWMVGTPELGQPQQEVGPALGLPHNHAEILRNIHTRWLQELSARQIERRLPDDPPKREPKPKAAPKESPKKQKKPGINIPKGKKKGNNPWAKAKKK